ncbi:hypothetical protein IL306_014416 [Fusarium sp. DS 682]|nr:hypothetical protein IL306_014416 [Fusarium sp. DS 682]
MARNRSYLSLLDRKILAWRRKDDLTVPWDPFRGGRLLVIGQLLRIRFFITKSIHDLDAAIEKFEHAARRLKTPDSDWMTSKAELAFTLVQRFRQVKSIEDLDRAIQIRRDLSWHWPSEGMELHQFFLSESLSQRFEVKGCRPDATEAIGMLQSIAEATTDLDHKANYLSSLSHIQLALFLKFRSPENLRESVATARLSTQVKTENTAPSDQAVYFSILGRALKESWSYTSARLDLEDAIDAYEKALQLLQKKDQNYLTIQSNLGCLFRLRFNESGRWDDLKRAFELAQTAVEESPSESVEVPGRMVNLSAVLETIFEVKGQREDLDNAIQCIRSAIDVTPKEHERYDTVHGSLCRMLQLKFELDGLIEDLYSAIDAGEVSIAGVDDSAHLDNLASAYQRRYDWLQSTDTLDRAIVLGLADKGNEDGNLEMLDEAIEVYKTTRDATLEQLYNVDTKSVIP